MDKSVFMLLYCPSPQVHQENQHLTQLHPEREPMTVGAPMKGNTITPLPTSSATTLVTATAAASTATPNLPPLAVLPHPVRCRKPATSRWEGEAYRAGPDRALDQVRGILNSFDELEIHMTVLTVFELSYQSKQD